MQKHPARSAGCLKFNLHFPHAVERCADGGGKRCVFGNNKVHAVELLEKLKRLFCGRQHRQRAREHDRIRPAALARQHRHRADGLKHEVHDAEHLVRRCRIVGNLGEVRRRGLGREVAHLLAREVGHRQVDVAEVAVLAELADQRVLVYACRQRAEARERAAAHAAADEVTDLSALVGPEKRCARAHTDDDRVLLAREGKAAHADGGEFFDLDGLHAVDIALDIRRAHARKRDVADVGELEMMCGKESYVPHTFKIIIYIIFL